MSVHAPPKPNLQHLLQPGFPSLGEDTPVGAFVPQAPEDFVEAGLDESIVESLILKYLTATGSASGGEIATELCLPGKAVIDYLGALKQQQIVVRVDSAGMSDFKYTLTDAGRDRAQRFLRESMYVGAAPVPLPMYIRAMRAQTITKVYPKEEDLRLAFSDLLISDEMFDILGPAINSGRGMFLYGSPGNGKTSIAERVSRSFGDEIYIPKCLIADGYIIKLFDGVNHEVMDEAKDSILKKDKIDHRWVKIRRPTIVVGGELTMDALEVRFDTTTKVCEAPVQLRSNGGTLLIDDFGRQRMRPIELLNRWIVPLEKRYDFLALPNGKKLQVPFDQLIIFSTNLEPKDLCDDAFLRRIPYKINVPDPTEAEFRELFSFVGPALGFTIDEEAQSILDYLIDMHYKQVNRPFRCCQPRDLMLQVRNRCRYTGQEPVLTPEMFDYAVSVYFTIM